MDNLIKINSKDLAVKEFKGQRVVTFKDIDALHERVKGTAKRNFNENEKQFIENVDYFKSTWREFSTKFVPNSKGGNPNNEIVLITESGYLMLVKSFQDDLAWKVQRELVNNYFRNKKSNGMDALKLMNRQVGAVIDKLDNHDTRIQKIENTMTIDYAQQEELNRYGRSKVVKMLGGKEVPAYNQLSKKAFSQFWNDYKRYMGVNSYKNTAVKDIDKACKFIDTWVPSKELKLMIAGANAQMRIREEAI